MARLWLLPILTAVLAVSNSFPAAAFNWERFAGMDEALRACLSGHLSEGEIADLSSGERPASKPLRKKAKAAYRACDCPAPPAPYGGPLFDAMAQIDETVDMTAAMGRV